MAIRFTYNTLTPRLAAMPQMIKSGLWALANAESPRVQSRARADAPWRDQTGNARQGLFSRPEQGGNDEVIIHLFHTMPYGIYLETRWSGRYEVIVPTILTEGRRIMQEADSLLSRMV